MSFNGFEKRILKPQRTSCSYWIQIPNTSYFNFFGIISVPSFRVVLAQKYLPGLPIGSQSFLQCGLNPVRSFQSCGIGLKHRCLFHVLFIICLICNSHFKFRVILPEETSLISQIYKTINVLVGVAFKRPQYQIAGFPLELSHSRNFFTGSSEGAWLVVWEQHGETAPTALLFLQKNHPREIQDSE